MSATKLACVTKFKCKYFDILFKNFFRNPVWINRYYLLRRFEVSGHEEMLKFKQQVKF